MNRLRLRNNVKWLYLSKVEYHIHPIYELESSIICDYQQNQFYSQRSFDTFYKLLTNEGSSDHSLLLCKGQTKKHYSSIHDLNSRYVIQPNHTVCI